MHLRIKEAGTVGLLTLEGTVWREQERKLRFYLHQALVYQKDIIVDCTNVTGMSGDSLMLLCSANRAAAGLKKNFSLQGLRAEVHSAAAAGLEGGHCNGCDTRSKCCCFHPSMVRQKESMSEAAHF
jgi:anti-anti-sigma regulatory factor